MVEVFLVQVARLGAELVGLAVVVYSFQQLGRRASALRSSVSRMARESESRARCSVAATRGALGGELAAGAPWAGAGRMPSTTVTLPPSTTLQPRFSASLALV